MAKYLTIIAVILISFCSFGQTGSIKGIIKTSDGQPAEYVSVGLKGTSKGTTTNSKGEFEIKNIATGNYILVASFIGLETHEQQVEVKANETTLVPEIILKENAQMLNEVVIMGNTNPKPNSEQLSRMPIDYMQDIQNYSVANKETIKELGATDFVSALRAVPGAGAAVNTGFGYASLILRGFRTIPMFRNGVAAWTHGGGDPQNLERIEVLRGPTGALFTSNASWTPTYGGIINKVTKTAFNGKLTEAGVSYGSYNLTRFAADFNTPLSDKVFFRLNAAYQIDPLWQEPMLAKRKDIMVAPVLVYKVNDKLNFKVEAEINANYIPQTFYFDPYGLDLSTPRNIKDLKLQYNKHYADPSFTYSKPVTQNFFAVKSNYAFNNNWKLSFDLQRTMMNHNSGVIYPTFINDTLMARQWYDFDFHYDVNAVQLNLNGKFKTGPIHHNVLVGASAQMQVNGQTGMYVADVDTINLNTGAVPAMNAVALRANTTAYIYRAQTQNASIYVADQVDLTDRLHAMLSLGFNWFKNPLGGSVGSNVPNFEPKPYEQSSLTPRLGLVYELIKGKTSLFANYTTGFSQVPPSQLQTFNPEFARQFEGGIKIDLNKRFTSTISYYNVEISNVVRRDPNNPLLSIQDGTRISTGIDAEVVGSLFDGFKVIAGYGFNDSKFTRANDDVQGKRPAGTAFHNANLWATYTLQNGKAKGLGIGIGGNHYGQTYVDDLNTLIIPAYTLLNSTVFYNAEKYRLSLNLNNMTNQKYWSYEGMAQKPINFLASLTIKI